MTLDTLHNRMLRACDCAATRALSCECYRLANVAEQVRTQGQLAYMRRDTGLLARALAAACAIGRRVRRQAGAL